MQEVDLPVVRERQVVMASGSLVLCFQRLET